MRRAAFSLLILALMLVPAAQAATTVTLEQERVRLSIPAVGQSENGTLFGIASDLEVVMQRPGSGRVYVSTQPLTEVDMQGSARLAVDAASATTGISADKIDFFFSVRTPAVTIGGPSAGGAMAVAVVALLQGWDVRESVVMTGMINPDGSIGPIGGVLQKLEAADSVGADTFLVPLGQSIVRDEENRVVDAKERGRERYGIDVIEVADLYDAVGPFTGNSLVRPTPSSDPLKDAAYTALTERLSENLTQRAQTRQRDLHERYAAANVPAQSDRNLIQQTLQTGDGQLANALASRNESRHYLSASQAFQSLVSFGYAEALISYFESEEFDDVRPYAERYLQTTDAFMASVEREVAVEYPIRAAQLDSVGASEDRFMEAQSLQGQAEAQFQQRNYGETLRLSSFARERAESARWWTDMGKEVASTGSTVEVSEAQIRELLDRYTDAATLELEYAALISADQPNYQAAAQAFSFSQTAREQRRFAASLTNLVEAFARTSTSLVQLSGDEPVRARLPGLADAAAYEIEVARGVGIPPIYAVSVLELGQSQAENDPVAAYASMLQARISARTSLQIAKVQTEPPGVTPYRGSGLGDGVPAWIGLAAAFAVIVVVLVIIILRAESRGPQARAYRTEPEQTLAPSSSPPTSPPDEGFTIVAEEPAAPPAPSSPQPAPVPPPASEPSPHPTTRRRVAVPRATANKRSSKSRTSRRKKPPSSDDDA